MSFRMKLTSLPADGGAFGALQFLAQCHDARGQVTRSMDSVRDPVVGREIEYGALFAYLFRRFGCPNASCDVDRLGRYVLTTPYDDLYLVVEPTIAGETSQVFSFFSPMSLHSVANTYCRQLLAKRPEAGDVFWAREQRLSDWSSGDPLKLHAQAAQRALRDLLKPVWLDESGAIDIFGAVPRTARSVRPASTPIFRPGS